MSEPELIQQVCDYITENIEQNLTLDALGAQFHISPSHLQRTFKRVTGISPREYADAQRIARFKENLRDGEPVTDALYAAGFSSSSRLYERSDNTLGMTPSTYRKGGAGMVIRYSVSACDMGYLMAAATKRGLCMVALGDTEKSLIQSLEGEFHAAEITRDDDYPGQWVAVVLEYLSGSEPHLDLPLDVRATAFQQRVWSALRRIPYGETRTYSQIAEAIGQPTAARAVARACATNPAALVIPCHRVIRNDGGMGGYRWDIKRKVALLEMEGAGSQSNSPEVD